MKIKFTDSKQYNIIFKDALTEEQYEKLVNKSNKGEELASFYELPSGKLNDLFDDTLKELGYPIDDNWFISPEVLQDSSKMDKLYKAVRTKVLNILNDEVYNEDLYSELGYDDYKTLKNLFKIQYAFKDRLYVTDDNIFEEFEQAEEDEESEKEDTDNKLLNATCQEYLEEFENKIDKKDPKWYLIQMALNKDKNWAYIKKADELKGDPELDIVTPKRAKKMMQELS